MFALFALRLAFGLAACLLLLPNEVNPRFYRTHFLTILGLAGGAAVFSGGESNVWFWLLIGAAMLVAFAGSIAWHIEGTPGGMVCVYLLTVLLGGLLSVVTSLSATSSLGAAAAWPLLLADNFSAALLLGSALTAMLMGHLYLIAPSMSLTPLFRLIFAFALAVLLRLAFAGVMLWNWRTHGGTAHETELILWLSVRWIVGIIGPLVLGWMAWETSRIRSTQSATGILYVVVILVFLGELTSQLLLQRTGLVL